MKDVLVSKVDDSIVFFLYLTKHVVLISVVEVAAALLKLPTPKKAEEILQSMEDNCLVLGDRYDLF